MSRKELEKAVA
jgi:hypothetical protein